MDWRRVVVGHFSWKRVMADVLLLPALVYVGLMLYAWLCADRSIFLPQRCSYTPSHEHVPLTTPDGETLCAVYLPNPGARFTLLYSHGNAEDLGDILPEMEALRAQGFAVLAYDYRGYGLSTGRPTVQGACADVLTAYRYLTATLGIPPERIVPYGRSVGGGPAVYLAASQPVGGLILQSAFTSAFVVVTRVPIVPFDRFPNLSRLRQVRCPVLVMHGRRDGVIPFAHGLRLYERAPEPKRCLWIDDVGHNSFPGNHQERYFATLHEFAALLALVQGQGTLAGP